MKQLFIGLDVHKKTGAVTIQQQLILKRFTREADAALLTGRIRSGSAGHRCNDNGL